MSSDVLLTPAACRRTTKGGPVARPALRGVHLWSAKRAAGRSSAARRNRLGHGCHDADDAPAALDAELHGAGREGEQGVVPAAADVLAGVEVRAALPDEDLAGVHDLPAEPLDAEALRVGVAPVPRGAGALL